MAKPGKGMPLSAADRQAASTVQSAKMVVAEIEAHRRVFSDTRRSRDARCKAKHQLLEASERLCNLMTLAVHELTTGVNRELQGRLWTTLDDLRGRLLDMGTKLMIEKLGRIHDRAESVLEGGAYPLGLATTLDHAYSSIIGNMDVLGALDRLDGKSRELVDDTAKEIETLAGIEASLGILTDMDETAFA